MPRWLQTVLARIREDARAGRVRFTHKALRELTALELGLDLDDCCDVLDKLGASDFAGRVKSLITSEWMYVFKPMVTGTRLHLKLILRRECIIISSTRRTTTMVTRAQPRSKVRRKGFGTRFPDDACPKCGTIMRERRATLRLPVNGEEVAVPDSAHLRCPKCGEVVLRM